MRTSKRDVGLFTIFILVALVFWTNNLSRPYYGHHDWDNVKWTKAAENYQWHGLWKTRLAQLQNAFATHSNEWVISHQHPPGISLFTYVGLELFGSSELAARLPSLGASLVAAALLFVLARRLYGKETAYLALFFFIFSPMMVYYSTKIGHEQFTLPLMLFFMLCYRRPPTPQSLLIMSGMIFIGGFISWAWYLFVGLVGLYTLWRERWGGVWARLPLWIAFMVTLMILLIVNIWGIDDYLSLMRQAFGSRTYEADATPSIQQAFFVVVGNYLWLPTPVVTSFALIALVRMLSKGQVDTTHPEWTVGIIILTGLIYTSIFWYATYIHDYLIYYIVTGLCIWAALGFRQMLYTYGTSPKPLWRGIFYLLLLLFVVGSVRWSSSLHTADTVVQRYSWGIVAGSATEPDEIIITNLEELEPSTAYYARRGERFDIPLEAALNDDSNWGFYIYCSDDRPDNLLEMLAEYQYEFDTEFECYLIDLKK